jgi:signal transduction histidine kinase
VFEGDDVFMVTPRGGRGQGGSPEKPRANFPIFGASLSKAARLPLNEAKSRAPRRHFRSEMRSMPFLATVDLKLRLALRVAAASAFCLVAAFIVLLWRGDADARAHLAGVAELVARDLSLQWAQAHWVHPAPGGFPDLQRTATPLTAPGLCILYRDARGEARQSLCGGPPPEDERAPESFAWLYRLLFDPGAEVRRPVAYQGETIGWAAAADDPESRIARVWRETARFLALMAATLVALWLLVYAALARALRPTRQILDGLRRLAANDLSARLAPFDLAELSAIRTVFNGLAEQLEATLAERRALTRRLIEVQDAERRSLARDLHDEFGQSLAAIAAVAASIAHTARAENPALVPECESISRTSAQMMTALRGALTRLRPPELDDLGLVGSLDHLVAGWIGRGGATRFQLIASGSFDDLPPFLVANLYRIAQEGLTNAAKHAEATEVTLRLARRDLERGSEIELSVTDDGKADVRAFGAGEKSEGLGLVGIRERVAALEGRIDFARNEPQGVILRVAIPVPRGAGAGSAP